MDLLSMLQNAFVFDSDGNLLGEITGVNIADGKLTLTMNPDEDDDDGEEEDEVDPEAPAGPIKFGKGLREYKKDKDDG